MDFKAPVSEQAATLLRKLVEVGEWAIAGDPRAKPYLDAGAVRIVDGNAQFHRDLFLSMYADELVAAVMAPADRIIAAGKAFLEREKEHN
jgi:hypothetical protein